MFLLYLDTSSNILFGKLQASVAGQIHLIPGLVVNRSNGQGSRPGDEATFSVRDVSSVNGGWPLVLIDGAEG